MPHFWSQPVLIDTGAEWTLLFVPAVSLFPHMKPWGVGHAHSTACSKFVFSHGARSVLLPVKPSLKHIPLCVLAAAGTASGLPLPSALPSELLSPPPALPLPLHMYHLRLQDARQPQASGPYRHAPSLVSAHVVIV